MAHRGRFVLARFLTTLLYAVKLMDPITLSVVAFLSGAMALGPSYVPARSATRIDPAIILRSE